MAEERQTNEKLRLQFMHKDFFYSIPEGMALVKKNFITGKIKVVGKMVESTERITYQLSLHNPSLTADKLNQMLGVVQTATLRNKITAELVYRTQLSAHKADPINVPAPIETEDLKNASVSVPAGTVIVKRVKEKTGIRIRWPWQSALVLNLKEQEIDNAPIQIDTSDRIRLQFDTDYRYKIVDPKTYAVVFNSLTSQYGKNATKQLDNLIGKELDQIVTNYVLRTGVDSFKNMSDKSLYDVCKLEIKKLGVKYGIEVTKVLISDIKYPQQMVEAEAARKAAQAKSAAARAENEDANRMAAMAEIIKTKTPGLSEEEVWNIVKNMLSAQHITTTVNTPFNIGVPQQQAQPAPEPVQQPTPQPAPQPAPQNLPEWFDNYVDYLYDANGKILQDVWDAFRQSHKNIPAVPPKISIMNPDLFDELCNEMGVVPPVRGNQK